MMNPAREGFPGCTKMNCTVGANRLARIAALLALPLGVAGCPPARSPTEVKPPVPRQVTSDPAKLQARSQELQAQARRLSEIAHQLPGRSDQQHRQLMAQTFAQLTQLLPLLGGPEQSGSFQRARHVIEASRTQLGQATQLSPDPTIDTGLRAAYRAVAELAQDDYFQQAKLPAAVDHLKAKLDELDSVRGSGHQWVASEVVRLVSGIVTRMADVLSGFVEQAEEPATAPAPSTPKQQSPDSAPAPAAQ